MQETSFAYRHGHDTISDEQLFFPMQDQTAGEVTTRLDCSHSGHNLLTGAGGTVYQIQYVWRRRLLAEPSLIIRRHVYGTAESLSPLYVGSVEMWVGDDNGSKAAF